MAVAGSARRSWLACQLAAALTAIVAGIYLWHALHSGVWRQREHLLVVGSFCATIAFSMQLPCAFDTPRAGGRLTGPALTVYRLSAVLLVVAVAAMVGSRYA